MTIDALQVLTTQIVVQVQDLVSMSSQHRTRFDLLQSLHTAFGQGLAIVGGLINAAAPINRIPPEIMATIFALSSVAHSPPSGHGLSYWPFERPSLEDLHRLPKVCRHWRQLALATPTLWNNIVTLPHSSGSETEYDFRRSRYLPNDLSVGLNVHLTTQQPRLSMRSLDNMAEYMVKNAPRIREFHAWNAPWIDYPSFLQSIDANSLEHCTIAHIGSDETSFEPGHHSLFSNGGARLRSLCLGYLRAIPKNEFPALTLLKMVVCTSLSTDVGVCWAVDSFVKFLSGSPNLEDVYIEYTPFSTQSTSSKRSTPPTTISLPHLRHLAFSYFLDPDHYYDDDISNPIDLLLEQVSFPPTCHMYLATPLFRRNSVLPNTAVDILASVCRHFPEKNSISHVFFELPGVARAPPSPMQLVFPQGGSLRLDVPEYSETSTFPHHDLFRAFLHLFSTTRELRIHYTSDPATATLDSLLISATFPNISTLAVIRDAHKLGGLAGQPGAIGTLRAGLAHLVTSTSPHGLEPDSEPELGEHHGHGLRYPLLDTLWTTLESGDEIEELETALAARAALGLPIRRLVVTLRYSPAMEQPEGPGRDDLARLRALDVEEVIVMDGEISSDLREVDWLTRLPDRYDLPSSIHRDWPAVWGME